jgi:hypothetical protein
MLMRLRDRVSGSGVVLAVAVVGLLVASQDVRVVGRGGFESCANQSCSSNDDCGSSCYCNSPGADGKCFLNAMCDNLACNATTLCPGSACNCNATSQKCALK